MYFIYISVYSVLFSVVDDSYIPDSTGHVGFASKKVNSRQ